MVDTNEMAHYFTLFEKVLFWSAGLEGLKFKNEN